MSVIAKIFAGSIASGIAAQGVVAQVTGANASLSDRLAGSFGYIIAAIIILLGVALGLADLLRLNPKRIWAIGSVSFRESIRRRVLWVTPLAMLGIIAVSQLSHPFDEQDAIRQTTKYCLFASGVVVVIATLILACTSLPKEIDNRVIYTIVTKPATRLEIVLGKTVGFARTSAAILLVMGIFSYAYLQINAAQLTSSIRARLANLPQTDQSRDTLRHYADEGLLQARNYTLPAPGGVWGVAPGLQMYAKVPQASDPYKWVFGNNEQDAIYPFELPDDLLAHPDTSLIFTLNIATNQPRPLTRREIEAEAPDPTATTRATTQGVAKYPGPPRIAVTLLNENAYAVVTPAEMMDPVHQSELKSADPEAFKNVNSVRLEPSERKGVGQAIVVVPPKPVQEKIAKLPPAADGKRRIYLMITGITLATQYGYGANAVGLSAQISDASGNPMIIPIPRTGAGGKELPPTFRGRLTSTRLQQLRGEEDRTEAPVGVFEFRQQGFSAGEDEVPFEFRTKVERTSDAQSTEAENMTRVEVEIRNRKTGYTSPAIEMTADSDRPTFFRAPRAAVDGGDFDLHLRSRTEGHFVGLRPSSVAVVSSSQSFAFNLLKSLLILWMLSVLVVIISVFCSTFVSWPIAVVLTLVILLGRWCVTQLGDPASPQQMATDLGFVNPVSSRVFTDTLGALNKLLTITAKVLPDLDQFRVTEDIERGVSISTRSLIDPLMVLLTFGTLLLILAYLLLRKKEVAP
ncbi:MAG: family transporter protein [Phycisphaerales bacterium]|nr:family transporter protein [Phycisphaerales bacterium]